MSNKKNTQIEEWKKEVVRSMSCLSLINVENGNVNNSTSESNTVTAKKYTAPDHNKYPYFSDQFYKHHIRNYFKEHDLPISRLDTYIKDGNVIPPCDPIKNIDEDMFGYFDPKLGISRKGPVSMTQGNGLFYYKGDRDFGTRHFDKMIYNVELYTSLFKMDLDVDLTRFGVFEQQELPKKIIDNIENQKYNNVKPYRKKDIIGNEKIIYALNDEVRKDRIEYLFDAINELKGGSNAGGVQALYSRFLLVGISKYNSTTFIDSVNKSSVEYFNNKYHIKADGIKETLKRYKNNIIQIYFGFDSSIIECDEVVDVINKFSKSKGWTGYVGDVSDAIEELKKFIKEKWRTEAYW